MGKRFFLGLAIMAMSLLDSLSAAHWNKIRLPHQFVVPVENVSRNVYSTQMPSFPLTWLKTTECGEFQPPSIHWKSHLIPDIKGISFKGLVFKLPELKDQGDSLNSFAVFFHEYECYAEGSEYGWFFSESDLPSGKFYLCYDCNSRGTQKWVTWPGNNGVFEILDGDAAAVEKALEDSGIYRYWNIKVTPAGNFILQLVNPSNYENVSVTLKKPDWYPNLYSVSGYLTVTAKKQAETSVFPAPYMHVDDVKVLQ